MKRVVVFPTNYCNFDCQFCGYKKSKGVQAKSIDISVVKKLLKVASKKNYKTLHITGGGEPLLVPNKVIGIIKLAKKYRFKHIDINTNTSYLNSKTLMKKLKYSDLDRFSFSIDYDHLRFVSYSSVIQAIKEALNLSIKVTIKVTNRRRTRDKNLNLIKKIAKSLGGVLITFPSPKGFCDRVFFVILPKNIIVVLNSSVDTCYNKNLGIIKKDIKKLIFDYCSIPTDLIIDANSYIFNCMPWLSVNNPKLFGLGKFTHLNNKSELFHPFLVNIINKKLAFIIFYLRIQKNKKLSECLKRQKFYSKCDLCMWLLKHKKIIEKFPPVSNFQLFWFVLPRFYRFLPTFFTDLYSFILCESELIKIMGNLFNNFIPIRDYLHSL